MHHWLKKGGGGRLVTRGPSIFGMHGSLIGPIINIYEPLADVTYSI